MSYRGDWAFPILWRTKRFKSLLFKRRHLVLSDCSGYGRGDRSGQEYSNPWNMVVKKQKKLERNLWFKMNKLAMLNREG